MPAELARTGVPSAHRTTRQRVESEIDIQRLFRAIDADPVIAGAGVVYIESEFAMVTLREFQPLCSIARKTIVLREAPRYVPAQEFIRELQEQPRESRLVAEAVNMGLSCTSAVIGWLVMASGAVALPITGGGSSLAEAAGIVITTAGTIQCTTGLDRVFNEVFEPHRNDQLDREDWYGYTQIALDAVALAGVGTASLATLRMVKTTKAATGKSTIQVLKGLNRQERAKLTRELLSIQHPGISTKMIKLRQLSGEFPKRFTSAAIRHGTVTQLVDALGASVSFAGSSFSGNVRTVAIGLYEEAGS